MIDIPDFSRLQPRKPYRATGATWQKIERTLRALACGENIETKGGNIYKRPGDNAVALAARKADLNISDASAPLTPLHGVDASVNTLAQVRVIFGTIGGKVPTLGVDYVLLPTGSARPQPTLALAETNTIVYAIVTIDPVSGTTVDIEASDGPGAPSDSITNGRGVANVILFGVAVHTAVGTNKKSVTISQVVLNSLSLVACGSQVTFGTL